MSGIGAVAAAVLEAPAEEVMAIEDRPESTGNVFVSLLLVEVPMAAVVRTVWLPWFQGRGFGVSVVRPARHRLCLVGHVNRRDRDWGLHNCLCPLVRSGRVLLDGAARCRVGAWDRPRGDGAPAVADAAQRN